MINATLSGEKIHSNSEEAFSLYEKSCFGEKKENKIVYSLIESLFLVSAEKITVHFNSKPLNFEKLLSKTFMLLMELYLQRTKTTMNFVKCLKLQIQMFLL